MVQYNPFSDQIMKGDPYPIYAQLRDEAPAYYIEEYEAWALSRFEDIWNCSMDAEHFSAAKGTTSAHLLTKVQPVTPMLNLMDPPQHTKLRSKMRKHFQPGALRELEPLIRGMCRKQIEAARETGSLDVNGAFSQEVATTVACTVNGIPIEDAPLLDTLVKRFFQREPGIDGMTPDGLAAMEELFGYFVGLAQKKRGAGGDDVVSLLTDVELDGEKLDDMSIASHLSMLIIGGSETFPKVFSNLAKRLAENPDQRAQLAADPGLIPDAFTEGVRLDMPTQFLCRTVSKDIEIQGQKLRTGNPVLFLYPSANRDPREFDDPDRFDIHRQAPRILSFGHGTHLCLGIHVAKLEGRLCVEELLKRVPEYELDMDAAEWLTTDFVQGWGKLPIRFAPF